MSLRAAGGGRVVEAFRSHEPKARGFWVGFGRQGLDFYRGAGDTPSRIHETAPRRPALSRPIHIIRRNCLSENMNLCYQCISELTKERDARIARFPFIARLVPNCGRKGLRMSRGEPRLSHERNRRSR
jgi:hypothetical protein